MAREVEGLNWMFFFLRKTRLQGVPCVLGYTSNLFWRVLLVSSTALARAGIINSLQWDFSLFRKPLVLLSKITSHVQSNPRYKNTPGGSSFDIQFRCEKQSIYVHFYRTRLIQKTTMMTIK